MVKAKSGIEVGKTYHTLTGVVTYSYGHYKLLPTTITEKEIIKETLKAVQGYAFIDINHNGKYDRPDKVLKHIKVSIFKDGQLIEEVTTDTNGEYKVLLRDGEYVMKFEQPTGLIETFNNRAAETIDSDIVDGVVSLLINDQPIKHISAGYTKPVGKMKQR
ncbi:SdrD B-like domain-containing protein [Macrococcoides caseolyticum]|uniref:SdrD B-like domain-containing protein n=1 Tax=Macrococcoides caseolyticum TaxID=69966 RepID=UPI001F1DAB95|nr:SdrD B-like domain-containing protein [Macrococcus caseolyticus]MCE4956460.1 hypothetical protein [Macrococcus caseolyticus]